MVEINLLPKEFRKQSQPSPWKYAAYAMPFVALTALAVLWIPLAAQTAGTKNKINELNGNIKALEKPKAEYDALVQQQTELEKVTAVAKALKEQKTYWSNDLAMFSAQIPATPGVALKSLRMSTTAANALADAQKNGIFVGKNVRRELDLSGIASSQQAVITFLNTFEKNPNFGVNFKGMQREEQSGRYNFNATVGVVAADSPVKTATSTPAPAPTGAPSAPPAAPPAPAATGGSTP